MSARISDSIASLALSILWLASVGLVTIATKSLQLVAMISDFASLWGALKRGFGISCKLAWGEKNRTYLLLGLTINIYYLTTGVLGILGLISSYYALPVLSLSFYSIKLTAELIKNFLITKTPLSITSQS